MVEVRGNLGRDLSGKIFCLKLTRFHQIFTAFLLVTLYFENFSFYHSISMSQIGYYFCLTLYNCIAEFIPTEISCNHHFSTQPTPPTKLFSLINHVSK